MCAYLLDTNAAIALLKGKPVTVKERFYAQLVGTVALPTIVVHDLYWGALRSAQVEYNLENIRTLAANLPILDFEIEDARFAGEVRAKLAARGTPIGPCDTLIAGQATARALTVVTQTMFGTLTKSPA